MAASVPDNLQWGGGMRRRVSRFTTIVVLLAASAFMGPPGAAAQQAPAVVASRTIVPELALEVGPAGEVVRAGRIVRTHYSLASSVAQSADSTRAYRRTYWLEGGILLGLLFGVPALSASQFSTQEKVLYFGLGASIGFPVGALIGGQIPKRGQS